MSPILFVFGPGYGTVIYDPWAWLCASLPATLYLGIVYYVTSSFFLFGSVHDRPHVYGLPCPYLAESGPGYGAQPLGIELCTCPPGFCAWRYALLVGFLFLALCMSPTFFVRGSVQGFDVSVLGSVHGSEAPCDVLWEWLAEFPSPTLFIDPHSLFPCF